MSNACSAVVAGHLTLDIFPELTTSSLDQLETQLQPGRVLEVGPATLCTGGAVSNTGLTLNKLGTRTRLMGKTGNDLFGQAVHQHVNSYSPGLADDIVVDGTTSTSYTIVISAPGVDRIFLHSPGANDTFSSADVRYDALSDARLFHFGYPPYMRLMRENAGAQLVDMFRRAKRVGVTTSLDMALPDPTSEAGHIDWRAILESTLPYVDIFVPSIEEILYMLRRETYDELCLTTGVADLLGLVTPGLLSGVGQQLLEMGTKIVALKLGHRGLYVRTAGRSAIASLGRGRPCNWTEWVSRELWTPCFQADVVGTTGSGDATIAGFLSALLRDLSPEAAATAAVAVGACNVEAADALSGIRPWNETMQRIADGWERHDLSITAPGWRFCKPHHMWTGGNRLHSGWG